MIGHIYCITNKLNNKKYIGQTTKLIEHRFKEHIRDSKSKITMRKFYNAIRKYGENNFEIIELYATDDLDLNILTDVLNEKEIYFIEKYNTFKNGYNSNAGGCGARGLYGELNPNYGNKWSDERKRAASIILKNKQISVGEKNPMYGIKGYENFHSKNILQYNVFGEFVSEYAGASHAGECLKFKEIASISACCRNKRLMAFGYLWFFKEGFNDEKLHEKLEQVYNSKGGQKPVVQLNEKGEIITQYINPTQAGMDNNIRTNLILDCCNGKQNTTGGYIWMYYKDYVKNKQNIDSILNKINLSRVRPIVQLSTNNKLLNKYNSMSEASRTTGIHKTNISACCNNRPHYNMAGGFKWMYYDDYISLHIDK